MRSLTTPSYSQLLYNSYSSDPTLCDSLSHSLLLFYSLNIFPALSNRPRSSRLSFTATPTFFSFNDRRRLIAFFSSFSFHISYNWQVWLISFVSCCIHNKVDESRLSHFHHLFSLLAVDDNNRMIKKSFFFAQSNNGVNKKSYFCARVNEIIE